MAARWIGLTRPNNKKTCAQAVAKRHTLRECLHAAGAGGVLLMAAAMNFAVYPDALAAVVGGEQVVSGFVPSEPSASAAEPTVAQPVAVNEQEVRLLASTIWGEARGEGEDGMRAVAHVMKNRVGDRFGENLETVILTPYQFSVWNRGDPNRRLVSNPERYATSGDALITWEAAQRIAREVLSGQSVDPTNGALFYHTRAIRPSWARQGVGRQIIGQHIFYADVPDRGVRRTPRMMTAVTQTFTRAIGLDRNDAGVQVASNEGPRAGRVNGVIQHAPTSLARQPLPSETATATSLQVASNDVNAAATPTFNGQPITLVSGSAGAQ